MMMKTTITIVNNEEATTSSTSRATESYGVMKYPPILESWFSSNTKKISSEPSYKSECGLFLQNIISKPQLPGRTPLWIRRVQFQVWDLSKTDITDGINQMKMIYLINRFKTSIYKHTDKQRRLKNYNKLIGWNEQLQNNVVMFAVMFRGSKCKGLKLETLRISFLNLCSEYVDYCLTAYSRKEIHKMTSSVACDVFNLVVQIQHYVSDSFEEGVKGSMDVFLSSQLTICRDRVDRVNCHAFYRAILKHPEPYGSSIESFLKYMSILSVYKDYYIDTLKTYDHNAKKMLKLERKKKFMKSIFRKIRYMQVKANLPVIPEDPTFRKKCFRKWSWKNDLLPRTIVNLLLAQRLIQDSRLKRGQVIVKNSIKAIKNYFRDIRINGGTVYRMKEYHILFPSGRQYTVTPANARLKLRKVERGMGYYGMISEDTRSIHPSKKGSTSEEFSFRGTIICSSFPEGIFRANQD